MATASVFVAPAIEAARTVGAGTAAPAGPQRLESRRLRRTPTFGPRCPDCAGPLVFGEGCKLCPVCGFSACAT